jgi:TRAP-type C4-dicarboxylate transport system substrate-binding protein
VQKYLSVTRHAYTPFLVLYSKKLWDGLSKDEQAALRECAVVSRDEQRKVIRELSQASLDKIKGEGTIVNELNAQEAQRMREQAMSVWEKHSATIGPETVKMMQAEIEKVRTK